MRDIDRVKEKFQAGELDTIRQQLVHFICINHDDFFLFYEREKRIWNKDIELFAALRLYILERRTIDFRSEMLSQAEEISREVVVRGCGCDPAMIKQVKQDWTDKHAASWRAHRILEIIYVLNEYKDYFLDYLKNPKSPINHPAPTSKIANH